MFVVASFVNSEFRMVARLLVSNPRNEEDVLNRKKHDTPKLDTPVPSSRVDSTSHRSYSPKNGTVGRKAYSWVIVA